MPQPLFVCSSDEMNTTASNKLRTESERLEQSVIEPSPWCPGERPQAAGAAEGAAQVFGPQRLAARLRAHAGVRARNNEGCLFKEDEGLLSQWHTDGFCDPRKMRRSGSHIARWQQLMRKMDKVW